MKSIHADLQSLLFFQSIHQSLAALSKVIRGTQLLTPEVQKLATALLNQEVREQTEASGVPAFK